MTVLTPTRLKVEVKEETKNNQANKRAVIVIAEHFRVLSRKVKIVRGHHKPAKIVSIDEE